MATETVETYFRALNSSQLVGPVDMGSALDQTGLLNFFNSSSANATSFQAGNATAAVTYTFPTAAPASSGLPLASTIAGVLSWATKLTNLAAGTTSGDSIRYEQLKVLQVILGTSTTNFTTSSASFQTTNLTASITPVNTANKVLVMAFSVIQPGTSSAQLTIARGGSNILGTGGQCRISNSAVQVPCALGYLDSPSTTSATTYAIQALSNGGTLQFGETNETQVMVLAEINGL